MARNYQPKLRPHKDYPCRVCGRVIDACDMLIDGVDENNYSITLEACKNPICRPCYVRHTSAIALGSLGGKAKSEKKAATSRENGKKGGRPKKVLDKHLTP